MSPSSLSTMTRSSSTCRSEPLRISPSVRSMMSVSWATASKAWREIWAEALDAAQSSNAISRLKLSFFHMGRSAGLRTVMDRVLILAQARSQVYARNVLSCARMYRPALDALLFLGCAPEAGLGRFASCGAHARTARRCVFGRRCMGFRGCAAGGFGAFWVRLGRRVATWSRVLGCVVGATLSSRFRRVLCGPPTPRACFGGALAGFLVGICTRTTRPLLIYCIVFL